jgi:hypothetical protein
MRAVLFHGTGRLGVVDREARALADDEVRLHVERSGIRGSDTGWHAAGCAHRSPVLTWSATLGTSEPARALLVATRKIRTEPSVFHEVMRDPRPYPDSEGTLRRPR